MKSNFVFILWVMCWGVFLSAQETLPNKQNTSPAVVVSAPAITPITWNTDPLSPSKAAFYSAIFPGLGQIYNKRYWKAPIVWGAIGTGIYFFLRNSEEYNRYEVAYKSRIAGRTDDEFWGDREDGQPRLSTEGVRRAIKFYRRNKELSILVTAGLYVLNIIEANVDAHLKQFNVDDRLTVEPQIFNDDILGVTRYGMVITYLF